MIVYVHHLHMLVTGICDINESIENKIYIGVPRVRNAMPPPLPTPEHPGGIEPARLCVCAAARTHRCPAAQEAPRKHRAHGSGTGAPAHRPMNTQLDNHAVQLPTYHSKLNKIMFLLETQNRCTHWYCYTFALSAQNEYCFVPF